MATAYPLDQVDDLLDDLESAAKSKLPASQLFAQLLDHLRRLLACDSASLFVPHPSQGLLWLAHAGSPSEQVVETVASQWNEPDQVELPHLAGPKGTPDWFAVPIRPDNFSKGGLLVSFSSPPPTGTIASLLALLRAFADVVAIRQLADLEHFIDAHWQRLQTLSQQISNCNDLRSMATLLANELVSIVGAVRVSVASSSPGKTPELLAVSSVSSLDQRAATIKALTAVAAECVTNSRPVVRRCCASSPGSDLSSSPMCEDGTFPNLVALPLTVRSSHSSALQSTALLIFEWLDSDGLLAATPLVSHLTPSIATAWHQQQRWLELPRAVRWLRTNPFPLTPSLRRIFQLVGLLLAGLAAFSLLTLPVPFTIEAEAILEPVRKQTIFSTADGYVDELFVDDGQTVVAGTKLLVIRSPDLSLQIEELVGNLRTIAERRNGLRVALNQIDPNSIDAISNQGRLSSEIAQLDTQENVAKQKLELIRSEEQKLTLSTSLDGVAVARDLRQQLAARPVKRGDALLEVVDVDGPWQLKIDLLDRDSGYVLTHYGSSDGAVAEIDVVLDSAPDEHLQARVNWIAQSAENPLGQGCRVEVRAAIDLADSAKARMGSQAHAYFRCGTQPIWFVWCRPLVEVIQRKLWFRNTLTL